MYGTVQLIRSVSTAVAPELAARIRSLSVFTPRNLKKTIKIGGWKMRLRLRMKRQRGKSDLK